MGLAERRARSWKCSEVLQFNSMLMLLCDLPIWFCLFTSLTSVYASLQKKEGYSGGLQNLLLNILRNNNMCGITSREMKLRLKIASFCFLF